MRTGWRFSWSRTIVGIALWGCLWLLGMFIYDWVATGSAATAASDMGLHDWEVMLVHVAGALAVGGGVEFARGWQRRALGRHL
jgi:hypothetical protein